ncbi:gastrula zinc finger protein XlCGF8.2DB-like protein [Leptotrombidium deliense]|uniref:Gastrula zinc finger protein XlCGF8.2DB-like protein n=1 Tax=Leptotrombidium deliense TaxID=299467 RepID=A0A443SCL7_9ACAR|nr:gastrula zinc finger protein XlCGF8.2DB-like protein [Leptotrombidium deliense]
MSRFLSKKTKFTLNFNLKSIGVTYDFLKKSQLQAAVALEQCLHFLDSNAAILVKDVEAFAELPYNLVCEILSRDTFFADENDILVALIEWHRRHERSDVKNLFRLLRWNQINFAQFVDIVKPLHVISDEEYLTWNAEKKSNRISGVSPLAVTPVHEKAAISTISAQSQPSICYNKRNNDNSITSRSQLRENTEVIVAEANVSEKKGIENSEDDCAVIGDTITQESDGDDDSVELIECSSGDEIEDNNSEIVANVSQPIFNERLNDVHNDVNEDLSSAVEIETPIMQKRRAVPGVFTNESTISRIKAIIDRGEKKYMCCVCGRPFNRKDHCLRHVATIHCKQMPFECDICGKRYTQRPSLTEHIQSKHINQRMFACDICDKVYKTKNQLYYHKTRVHERRNARVCDVCLRHFKSKQALDYHIRTHHSYQWALNQSDEQTAALNQNEELVTAT